MMKTGLMIVGVVALAMGLLWVGQGLDYINWPKSSFMIKQITWSYYGGGLAVVGLIFIWFSLR